MSLTNFCPYILKETVERRPSSISVAAWTADQHHYINLAPGTSEADLPAIQEIIRTSHQENNGIAFNWGPIVGYRVVYSPTESLLLDTSGEVRRRQGGSFWPRTHNPRVES